MPSSGRLSGEMMNNNQCDYKEVVEKKKFHHKIHKELTADNFLTAGTFSLGSHQ